LQIVRIQKREVQACRVQGVDNFVDSRLGSLVVEAGSAAQLRNSMAKRLDVCGIEIVEVQFGKIRSAFLRGLVGTSGLPSMNALSSSTNDRPGPENSST